MTRKAKPYSLGHTIAVGVVTAAAFALLSLFFLYMQAQGSQHRLAGEVISVTSQSVTLRNAREVETVLVFSADVELRGVSSYEELDIGQHVMMRGSFRDDGTFEVERLRALTDRPRQ